jgi:hypothetical protein
MDVETEPRIAPYITARDAGGGMCEVTMTGGEDDAQNIVTIQAEKSRAWVEAGIFRGNGRHKIPLSPGRWWVLVRSENEAETQMSNVVSVTMGESRVEN